MAKINSYAGPLTPIEICAGIRAAQQNALRLLDDAKLLYENKRYPTAAALAILSLEERGKVGILKRLTIVTTPEDIKTAWKDYRNHRAKNAGWIVPKLVADGARTLGDFREATDPSADHTNLLDSVKQISVYTDCLGSKNWSEPSEVIEAELALSMIQAAEAMWNEKPITERELELWHQHVHGHYNQPTFVKAILAYQAAIHAEGLSETAPDELRAFMGLPPENPSA